MATRPPVIGKASLNREHSAQLRKGDFDLHFQNAEQFRKAAILLHDGDFEASVTVVARESVKCYLRALLCAFEAAPAHAGIQALWAEAAARDLVTIVRPQWMFQISAFPEAARDPQPPDPALVIDGLAQLRDAAIIGRDQGGLIR